MNRIDPKSRHYDPMDRKSRAGCVCNSEYLLQAAEAAISPVAAERRAAELFKLAPNPFKQGRANQKATLRRGWAEHAARLVWC